MKKTFTFFVAKGLYTTPTNRLLCKVAIFVLVALFALPVMAGTIDVLDNSWIVDHHTEWGGSSYNSETKTITFGGSWSGCGWYLAEVSTSDWVSITVEFASAAPHGVLKCEYTDASGGGTDETSSFSGYTSTTLNFNTSKTIKKIYLVLENSGSLTLTSAVVTTSTTTYTLSVTASNGTVSGTGDFAEGAEVTLTASPNANYSFTSWSTSDVNISGHENENPLTFTMPGNDVSITANFSPCSGQTVTVDVNDGDMGSATGEGSYCAGVQVDLEATPKSGYRFVNWTVTSGSASLDNVNNASTHFTMSNPAEAVTVQANFEVDPCLASLTVQVEDAYLPNGAVSASKGYPTTMIFKEKQAEGSAYRTGCNGRGFMQVQNEGDRELFIPVNITTAGNYKVKARSGRDKETYINIYAITGDGETITYNSTTYYKKTYKRINEGHDEDSFAYSDYTDVVSLPIGVCLIGLYSNYTWAAYDEITITCTDGTAFCPNTITMAKSGDDGADAPTAQVNSSNVTTAFEGTEVTITAGEASANHYFSGWTVSPENAVTFAGQTNATTTFVMPAEDVTITANYGAVVLSALTFSAGEGGSIVSATAGGNAISSGAEVISGTSVTLTAEANSNYVFINWTDDSNTEVSTNAAFTFSMPATATSYTANFAQIDNVIITGTSATVKESNGPATLTVTSVSDFDAFNHNVLKFAYRDMGGKYKGQKVATDVGYSSASSAGATGFGFYYKTEKADDHVAFCFEVSNGHQVKWQLQATNNVWKYYYFAHPEAASWEHSGIYIYMNGDDTGTHGIWNEQATHTTYKDGGAFYMSEIAATSITSKSDIANYRYTNDRGGAMQVDDYGTLCLPMAGTISGATLYSVAGKETGDINYLVLEDKGTSVEAGKPYITQSTATSYTVTMSGAHSAVQDGNGLVGTYETIDLTPYAEPGTLNYFLYANAFKKAGTGVTVGAYRAYLDWGEVSAPAQAPSARRIRMVIEGTEVQTGMETVTAMPKTTKVLIDGQLFIIREGKRYTLTGARAQ